MTAAASALTADQQALRGAVLRLIDAGCHYRLDELATLYAPELRILIVQPDGPVLRFDHAQNMAFFRQRQQAGAPPLDTAAVFNDIEVAGDTGYVSVTRRMALDGGTPRTLVFQLTLARRDGRWRVVREHAVVTGTAPATA